MRIEAQVAQVVGKFVRPMGAIDLVGRNPPHRLHELFEIGMIRKRQRVIDS